MIGDVWKGRKCAGKNRSERVFSDSGGENVKSEREGQGQYYIENFGSVLEDEGNTSSEQPLSSRFSLIHGISKASNSPSTRIGHVLLEYMAYVI